MSSDHELGHGHFTVIYGYVPGLVILNSPRVCFELLGYYSYSAEPGFPPLSGSLIRVT